MRAPSNNLGLWSPVFKNKKETGGKKKHKERLSECLIMEGQAKYPQTQQPHF